MTNPDNNQQKLQFVHSLDFLPQKIHSSSIIQSTEYYRILAVSQEEYSKIELHKICLKKSSNSSIKFNLASFEAQMKIMIINTSKNYQTIKICVFYGYFSSDIFIVNLDQNSEINTIDYCVKGSFSLVYKANLNGDIIAIKAITIKQDQFSKIFQQVIKEYFLSMIADYLGVGPPLIKIFGFDLVIFRSQIIFCMEFCQWRSPNRGQQLQKLRQKLILFHRIGIVHFDIKPQNIVFSPSLNQYVFIDFGLSKVVKQKVGEKTFVSFGGSINYCCKQLLQLFMNEQKGLVDLFYNDAYGLSKTIDEIKLQDQNIGEDQFVYFRSNKYLQKLSSELLAKFKLFQCSLAFGLKLQLSYQLKSVIINNKSIFKDFMLNLPPNLSIAHIFKQIFTSKAHFQDINNEGLDETIRYQIEQDNNLINDRFNKIKLCEYSTSLLVSKKYLLDIDFIRRLQYVNYQQILIKYIAINSYQKSFSSKVDACKVYHQVYINHKEQMSPYQLYKYTIRHIFDIILTIPQRKKYNFYFHAIQTLVILQIISEDQYIQCFGAVLLFEKISLLSKLHLIYIFINTLEFIRFKFRTGYYYEKLKTVFYTKLIGFISFTQSKTSIKSEIFLLKIFKYLIDHNLKCLMIALMEQMEEIKQVMSEYFQIKRLCNGIMSYLLMNNMMKQMIEYKTVNKVYYKMIILQINNFGYSNQNNQFLVMRLFIYMSQFLFNKRELSQNIYKLYEDKMKDYQQYKYFNIYFLQRIIQINKRYKKQWQISKQHNEQIQQLKNNFNYIQICQILSYLLQNQPYHFHHYFTYLSFLPFNIYKHICAQSLNHHTDKITVLSYNPQYDNRFQHNVELHSQILVKNHLICMVCLCNEQKSKNLSRFLFDNCKLVLNNYECFGCKALCLLEINFLIIRTSGMQQQQILFKCIDIFILLLKNSAYFKLALRSLINIYATSKQAIYQKYDLRRLMFELIKVNNNYHQCLIYHRYIIFVKIYFYIGQLYQRDEMVDFILNIVSNIQQNRSILLINNFYEGIQYIIKNVGKCNAIQDFKTYHNLIIFQILKTISYKKYYYLSLYFSALLDIRIRTKIQRKMIQTIALSLNFISNFAKTLILNNYYYHFYYYKYCPKRKRNYLQFKHLRFCSSKLKLKSILKAKMKNIGGKGLSEGKQKKIKEMIQKYHTNLQNI